MGLVRHAVVFIAFVTVLCGAGSALETDQFLAMDVELEDSGEVLNRFLNEQAAEFLDKENSRWNRAETREQLTKRFYFHLFKGLYASRLRSWVHNSDKVDKFPDESAGYFKHLRMSVFGMGSFPFILPLARTMRVGDVYLGTDKVGHFFGFGRRYFKRYRRLRRRGVEEAEAMERVVLHGLRVERYFVGNVVDGIFSYADLEANFRGMMMARALSEGEEAYFKCVDGRWILAKPIDIRPFITPAFDESYNRCHYIGRRKKHVFKALREGFCHKFFLPMVQERFSRYSEWPPSFSQEVIDGYYEERGKDPRKLQSLEIICGEDELPCR